MGTLKGLNLRRSKEERSIFSGRWSTEGRKDKIK
jgi:hypothetical protein